MTASPTCSMSATGLIGMSNPEMPSYASNEFWSGGYLHTRDIGTIDENGWVQITDRVKDVIKTGGEWVSSLEIEDIHSQL